MEFDIKSTGFVEEVEGFKKEYSYLLNQRRCKGYS
jgi:hypothetical protein